MCKLINQLLPSLDKDQQERTTTGVDESLETHTVLSQDYNCRREV